MNLLLTNWKLFAIFCLLGIVTALGLRASGGDTTAPHAAHRPEPAPKPGPAPREEPKSLLVDLGNTNCPINGGKVDGTTYTEWNNLRVAFCCPGCDTRFLKDPEAALEKAGIEWTEVAQSIAAYNTAPAEHRKHALDAIRKQWKVIREP